MDIDEVQRYVSLGSRKSVCVDLRAVSYNPIIVRSVTVCRDNVVFIRFRSYSFDEGGSSFRKQYETFTDVIVDLEKYLNIPITEWHNFTKSGYYPEKPLQDDFQQTLIDIIRQIPEGYINPNNATQ